MERFTTEQFILKSKEIYGDKYDYSLVDYKNNKTKVKIICPEHGIFEQRPNNHLQSTIGCIKCSNIYKPSITEFIVNSKKIHGDKYDYSLVDYKNNKIKVKIICPEHGIFLQTPNSHLQGHGCKLCTIMTEEKFIETIKKIYGDKYDYYLVNFENTSTDVKIICKIHGIFEKKPVSLLQGYGCPRCYKTSIDSFIKRSKEIHGDKYNYSLVNFEKIIDKVKIICPIHGIFIQKASSHYTNGCKKCADEKIRNTKEQFILKSKEIHKDKYDYSLVDYKNNNIKVNILCPIHGLFQQRPKQHMRGEGCPFCQESKGENIIKNFLLKNNIKFERQKKFNNCYNKNPLKFDFYLDEENICLEYDGEQHYEIIDNFGGKEGLKKTKINDQIKNDYCKNNNIKLLRIKYTEFNDIENILTNFLEL